MKRVGLCIFALLLLILPAQAQGRKPAQQQLIRLQAATFDPLVDGEPIAAIGPQAIEDAVILALVSVTVVADEWAAELLPRGVHCLSCHLVLHPEGYAKWTAKFDERGNRVERAFFGIGGEPTTFSGWFREVVTYDQSTGRRLRTVHYNVRGQVVK